jgi:hypothetical protein
MKRTLLAITAILGTALAAHASLIFSNSFAYPDGPLVTVSAGSPLGEWITHSGKHDGAGGCRNRKVNLTQSGVRDVSNRSHHRILPTPSFPARFTQLRGEFLPSADRNGLLFGTMGHRDFNFRARVWASTKGAAADSIRVGFRWAQLADYIPMDLSLNQDYTGGSLQLGCLDATCDQPTSEASA